MGLTVLTDDMSLLPFELYGVVQQTLGTSCTCRQWRDNVLMPKGKVWS
jgi:hypothetical protein